jgi:glycosyltransferase involved in cell wall biosynthesis
VNILLMLAHSIEEHDQVKLLSSLGYNVFSLGGYIDPAHPHDDKRPALPDAPYFPELKAAVDRIGAPDNLTAAKERIPDDILDWADVIICHHYEHRWIVPQWDRIKHKRVIWRTVGQSVENNERMMAPLHADGMEIIRYSPKEENIPGYAGKDALIRFYADPAEWHGWMGDESQVINVTQNLRQRDPYTNWGYWDKVTADLPSVALGPGSEAIGGTGALSYFEMQGYLRSARAYLYTGTQPASLTLGLIEALMTGIPLVSIGSSWMRVFPYGPDMFEGHELAQFSYDDPENAASMLRVLLNDSDYAESVSVNQRKAAIETFGRDKIALQWRLYLGDPARSVAA